ncbi:hypothetical protein [Candidatus Marinarcus aquaticus]|uniref:Uncharacterized protein n=1 Tax=Candidatus Marinarcus aquaticus TaxID=2044504 RepID=A0A4Q0XP93_9BACT|nr:hypothetical protein [Candidatus Marinarcus aquaticus]RXJ56420.1 hypothetical protein CRV04_08365 [Candidatus Marinarcus aquaticus]
MFGKSSQYVSIIKYYNQLKLDYKLLNNDDIIKAEQSTFLTSGLSLPEDVVIKLRTLEQNEPETYFSTVCDAPTQKLYAKGDKPDADTNVVVNLNSDYKVALDKSTLFETKYYFDASGIDYIYSPFHILNLHCEQNPSASALTGLILNDSLYLVILNEENKIVYYAIKALTSFAEIKESHFYDNEISGQKLFDEIYYYEIENIISTVLAEFYATKDKTFIDRVTILHMIKQLNDEQVNTLHKELLIEVNYHPISMDDYIYELAKQPLKQQKSFIAPRKKVKSKFTFISLLLFLIISAASVYTIYTFMEIKKQSVEEKIVQEKIQKEALKKQKELLAKKPALPNHMVKNRAISKHLLELFENIPYNVVLNSLKLEAKQSTMSVSLLEDDTFIRSMQPNFLKLYAHSDIEFIDGKSTVLNATIINRDKIEETSNIKEILPNYIVNEFLPKQRVHEVLAGLLGKDVNFEFKSDFQSEVSTFNYQVDTVYKTPKELFDLIERLNIALYSVNISYPIIMEKTDEGIRTQFIVQFHQNR